MNINSPIMSSVERQHTEEAQQPEPQDTQEAPKPKEITRKCGSGATYTEAQKLSAISNLSKANQGKLLKKDLERRVTELQSELDKANLEVQRQKDKKKREKQRANTLAELATKQNREAKPPPPKDESVPTQQTKQIAFEQAERSPPQDPRDNPKVRRFMAQGADLRTAMAMAGVR